MIPDPSAVKPEDWDDEEDGDFEAPQVGWGVAVPLHLWARVWPVTLCCCHVAMLPGFALDRVGRGGLPFQVPNPACETAPGCGKWVRPNIPNPAFKGKWTPPLIDNPEYKGEWKARQIPNPAYFVDEHPHRLPAMVRCVGQSWHPSPEPSSQGEAGLRGVCGCV
jgi:hypothetical protein